MGQATRSVPEHGCEGGFCVTLGARPLCSPRSRGGTHLAGGVRPCLCPQDLGARKGRYTSALAASDPQ